MSLPSSELVTRSIAHTLKQLITEEPVLVVNGARAVGKSTLLRELADSCEVPIYDLDDLSMRALAERDPTLIADAAPPVFVDEFQHVPRLLDAVKAELNVDTRPGRFVLTGSTRYLTTPQISQSLAGRVAIETLWPLSQGELSGTFENFLDVLMTDPRAMVSATPSSTSRRDYVERVLAGGYPMALRRSGRGRARWFSQYVDTVLGRDVLEIRKIRQRDALPHVLRRTASQSAGVLNTTAVARDLGIDNSVAGDYIKLLEVVLLIHRLPGWGRTLGSRVGTLPRVHLVDTGLAAHLLGLTVQRLDAADAAALTEYGHLVETFAVNEVLKQAGWAEILAEFGHFRTRDGDEVDLVVETHDGRVAGIEVKAGATVAGRDLSGLRTLRTKLGNRFVGGVALYTGTRSYTYEDRIHILPLDSLWQQW